MESSKLYEDQIENQTEIPVASRRSTFEDNLYEYTKTRKEIEVRYKEIRARKRRIAELIASDESLVPIDKKFRKITAEKEDEIQRKKKRRIATLETEMESSDAQAKKKIKNAIARKKKEHVRLLKLGYSMTEEEIAKEGGVVGNQYVYFKDLGDGNSSRHVMKGIQGLKLSSMEGPETHMEVSDKD